MTPDPGSPDVRMRALRHTCGRLVASVDPGARDVGSALLRVLVDGVDPFDAFGIVRPSVRTTQERRDRALLEFAREVGSDRHALAILRGDAHCPARLRPLLTTCRDLRVSTGQNAITRARKRVSPLR